MYTIPALGGNAFPRAPVPNPSKMLPQFVTEELTAALMDIANCSTAPASSGRPSMRSRSPGDGVHLGLGRPASEPRAAGAARRPRAMRRLSILLKHDPRPEPAMGRRS